jgi:ribosomal protein S27AE
MRRVYKDGEPTKKLKCEHCGNVMVEQEPVRVSDVVCGKCGMTTDKE